MNITKPKSIIFAFFITLFMGCSFFSSSYTTGFTAVDTNYAEKSGIIVTNFTDNPFFAYIYYDYSNIKDFNPSNIKVILTHNIIPIPIDNLDIAEMETEIDFVCNSDISRDTKHILTLPDKQADIIKNEPGYLKIFSLDDIGTYKISYITPPVK